MVSSPNSQLTAPKLISSRFLLKYITRDTVDLLSRGSGGVNEARSAVEKYEEKSPLYGLVQFRRKKVILKYVPEGTSRLLQGWFWAVSREIVNTTN